MQPAAVLSILVTADGVAKTNLELRKIQAEAKRTADSSENLDKKFHHLNTSAIQFNQAMEGARNVMSIIRWPAMIAGAGAAGQAIGTMATAAASLGAEMGPLVGAGAGVVGMYAAVGQGALVAKLALGGVTKALAGNKTALKNLTPDQKVLLDELKKAQKEVKNLRDASAAGMTPGLTKAVQALIPLMRQLQPEVKATAEVLGNLANSAVKMLVSMGPALQRITRNNTQVLGALGSAVISLAHALLDVLDAARPFTLWMANLIKRGAAYVSMQVQAAKSTGRLQAFLERSRQTMILWGRIIANVGVALFNIFRRATPMGNSLAASLEQITAHFRAWTQSASGQNRIERYFREAQPAVNQLFGLVGDLGKALGPLLTPSRMTAGMLAGLRQMVGPLRDLIQSTTQALGPSLIGSLTQIVKLFATFVGYSSPLKATVQVIGWLAKALNELLSDVPGLKPLAVFIVGFSGAWKLFGGVIKPFIGVIGLLRGGLKELQGVSKLSGDAQVVAAEEATASTNIATAAVNRLSAAWERAAMMAKAAGLASGSGALASEAKGASPSSKQLSLFPTSVGQAAETESKGFLSKFSAVASKGVSALGVGLGGVMVSQLAGSLIKGPAGGWVKTVGTGASIGGALGTVFGPGGTVVGALAGGLTGAVLKWAKGPDPMVEGRTWAKNFTSNMNLAPALQKKVDEGLARSQVRAGQSLAALKMLQQIRSDPTELGLVQGSDYFKNLVKLATQAKKTIADTGRAAAQAFITGFNQVSVKTTPQFIVDAEQTLGKLKGSARRSAAEAMVEYAQTLEAKGQLPKGATAQVIASLEQQYKGLAPFLRKQGLANSQAVAQTMQWKGALSNLLDTERQVRKQFGLWQVNKNLNGHNVVDSFDTEFSRLSVIAANTTGDARQRALAAMGQLKTQFIRLLMTMNAQTRTQMNALADKIQGGSATAASKAEGNFERVASAVGRAMNSGILSAQQGSKVMGGALNMMLSAFGQAKIPLAGLDSGSLTSWYQWWKTGSASPGAGSGTRGNRGAVAAQGMLMQVGRAGQAGQDTVPMNVGGYPIRVAPGEQVAVFNRHQQKAADMLMAPVGGLAGLFNSIQRPHSMQGGGLVPGFQRGGVLSQSAIAKLWVQAGGAPNMARVMSAIAEAESSGNESITNSIGATGLWQIIPSTWAAYGHGSPTNPMDNARAAVAILAGQGLGAWTTYTNGAYRQFMSGNVPGGGLGSLGTMLAQLPRMKVTGDSTVSRIVQAGFDKVRTAANAFAQRHESAAAPAGGALGPAGGPSGTVMFQGIPIAAWIAPVLQWAQAHGWGGSITSGYRPWETGSEHASTQYPGGAVDVGSNIAIPQGTALYNVLKGYHGSRPLRWGGIYITGYSENGVTAPGGHDYGHFSGTGHQRGGLVGRAYQRGGLVSRNMARGGAFRVMASSETAGGQGAFGFSPGGLGYSILSRSGLQGDVSGAGLAFGSPIPKPPNPLFVGHGGRVSKATLQDIGAGDSYRPSIGLYPLLRQKLRLPGNWNGFVNIERPDAKMFEALRGAKIPFFGPLQHGASATQPGRLRGRPYPGGPSEPRRQRSGFLHFGRRPHPVKRASAKFNLDMIDKGLVDASTLQAVQKFGTYETEFQNLWNAWTRIQPNLGATDRLAMQDGEWVLKGVTPAQQMAGYRGALTNYLFPAQKAVGIEAQEMAQAIMAIKAAVAKLAALIADLKKRIAKVKREIARREREVKGQRRQLARLHKMSPIEFARHASKSRASETFYKQTKYPSLLHYHQGIVNDDERRITFLKNRLGGGGPGNTDRKTLYGFLNRVIGDQAGWQATGTQLANMLTRYSDPVTPASVLNFTGGLQKAAAPGGYISNFFSIPQHRADLAGAIEEVRRGMAATTSTTTTDLAQLKTLQNQQAILSSLVELRQAEAWNQFKWPPFGGSFATGGIVPGPLGAPRTIIAHGGEPVGGASSVRVVLEDYRTRVFVDDIEQQVNTVNRRIARRASRGLPGAGGG